MLVVYLKLLGIGALVTAGVSLVSILVGIAIAVPVAAAKLAPGRAARFFGSAYISFFRGVPLLVMLLLIYHLLPLLGLNVPGVLAAIIGLSLSTSAYQAENLRGGFGSVSMGLIEAGRMLGMTPRQILLRIRLPIALRLTLPAILNEASMIMKASSLVSVVGVAELARVAQNLSSSTYRPLEVYPIAGAFYLLLNWAMAAGGTGLGRLLGPSAAPGRA